MSNIHWKNKYEIGHKRIDFEHQIFVDLISKLDDAAEAKSDQSYINGLLDELRAYAVFHFISEENIMHSVNYPDYDHHKLLHNKLLDKYSQKMLEINMNKQNISDFVIFLKDWFVHHTINEDKKIASFIKGKNI